MVIKNSTPWRTEDLRMLFRRCIREVEEIEKPSFPFHKRNKHFKLDILNTTRSSERGRASVNGYWIMIKIPKLWELKTELPTEPDAVDKESGDNIYYHITCKESKLSFAKIPMLHNQIEAMKKYPMYWKVTGKKQELDKEQKEKLAKIIIHEYYHTLGYSNWDRNNYKHDGSKNWNVSWIEKYPVRIKEVVQEEKVDVKLLRYQKAIQNLRIAETRFKRAKTLHKKWLQKVKYYEVVCGKK